MDKDDPPLCKESYNRAIRDAMALAKGLPLWSDPKTVPVAAHPALDDWGNPLGYDIPETTLKTKRRLSPRDCLPGLEALLKE